MTGAIIYFKEAVKGNENYIKWYIEKFTKKGVDFKLIYVEDIDTTICLILQYADLLHQKLQRS